MNLGACQPCSADEIINDRAALKSIPLVSPRNNIHQNRQRLSDEQSRWHEINHSSEAMI